MMRTPLLTTKRTESVRVAILTLGLILGPGVLIHARAPISLMLLNVS
jgi:hypothetical protein